MQDVNGKEHLVRITKSHHDYWTAAGEMRADCVCGWWDHHPYSPGGEGYATLKLQFRAADHVPSCLCCISNECACMGEQS